MNYADIQYVLVPEGSSDLAVCVATPGNFIARIVVQPQSTTVDSFYLQDGVTATDSEAVQHKTILTAPENTSATLQPYVIDLGIGPDAAPEEGRGIFMTCGSGAVFTVVGMLD